MATDHIGMRVRHWRLKRHLSQRALADLAGFSQGYISQVEAGTKPLDKRKAQVAMAEALQVSVADLTGQPYDPKTIEHNTAAKAMPLLRASLLMVSLDDRQTPQLSLPELRESVSDAIGLHNACRYDQLAPKLPRLLRQLHSMDSHPEVAEMLTWATYCATFAAKYLGYADIALLASAECRAAAARTEKPQWIGLAEFATLHALPSETKQLARNRVTGALDMMGRHLGDGQACQVYGMLHLTAAMFAAMEGVSEDTFDHLAEAQGMSDRTGEVNFAQLWFGPTNVAIWKTGLCAELGDGGRARELQNLNPRRIGSLNRQATFYSDLGRALSQTKRDDPRAIAAFLTAEAIAPQRVRLSPPVREAVGSIRRRARAMATSRDLERLVTRLGII